MTASARDQFEQLQELAGGELELVPAEPAGLWIVVSRWNEFQHPDTTRTGNIPWVKTFTRLLSDAEYLDLSGHERAVLHGLWLEYARARARLRLDTVSLSRRIGLRVTRRTLERLNHAGFIQFSASSPASSLQAELQDQTRQEKKDPHSPPTGDASNRRSRTPSEQPRVDPSKVCPDCLEPYGHGHLETCPRMPRTAE